jgi:hypothetical protein
MTVLATTYVGEPDLPAGRTLSHYRRSRPRSIAWWRRSLLGAAVGHREGLG